MEKGVSRTVCPFSLADGSVYAGQGQFPAFKYTVFTFIFTRDSFVHGACPVRDEMSVISHAIPSGRVFKPIQKAAMPQ
jgi:hypothetical protein